MHATPDDPVVDAFDRLLRDRPENVLLVRGRRRIRVRDIDERARSLGRRLAASTFPAATAVALIANNGPGFLAALIALRRGGWTALLVDAGAPEPTISRVVERFAAAGWIRIDGSTRVGSDGWRLGSGSSEPLPVEPRDRAAVIKLTSGSTGEPRGILTSSSALIADDRALTTSMEIRPDDRLLATVPFSHSYGLSSLVLPALLRGTLLVVPDDRGPFAAFEAAREFEATVFPTAPAYVAALLRVATAPALPPSLRLVLAAGSPLRSPVARGFRERFGRPVHVFYGASECGGISYDRSGDAAERGTVGQPVDGVTVELLPVPDAVQAGAGQIVVSSPALAERHLPDPDPRLGGGRFRTDDLGQWSKGELELTGRMGNLIDVRGRKVSPAEVERTIGAMPGVTDVCVVPFIREETGESIVRAVVCCSPGALAAAQVVDWCRARLSDFKVPRSVVLVRRMPVDERGKIDRDGLSCAGKSESRA